MNRDLSIAFTQLTTAKNRVARTIGLKEKGIDDPENYDFYVVENDDYIERIESVDAMKEKPGVCFITFRTKHQSPRTPRKMTMGYFHKVGKDNLLIMLPWEESHLIGVYRIRKELVDEN